MDQQTKDLIFRNISFVIKDEARDTIDKYLAVRECIDLLDKVYKETGAPLIYTNYKSKKKYPSKYNVEKLDRYDFNWIKDSWKDYNKLRKSKNEEHKETRKQFNIYIGLYPKKYEEIEELYIYILRTRLDMIESKIKDYESRLQKLYSTRDRFKKIINMED